jgi:predicted enzyme related to lactoylglutathione lyase
MHRSRLGGVCIDCNTPDLEAAARFWSAALGLAVRTSAEEDQRYRSLERGPGTMDIEVQQVEHASRVHLDIETDDIEAEVLRLTALGARPVQRIRTWVVMEAPTGQRFCVVRANTPEFDKSAKSWE